MSLDARPDGPFPAGAGAVERRAAGEAGPLGTGGRFVVPLIPPNLTGDLHLGHGLMAWVLDSQVRLQRQRGREVHFVPGVDHAGIGMYSLVLATPAFRPDLPVGSRLRAWAAHHRGVIGRQLRAMDLLCDWDRETYTMEPRYTRLVRYAFGRLAGAGLLYRGRKVVRWCPSCRTTISDVECERRLVQRRVALIAVQLGDRRVLVEWPAPELLPGAVAYVTHGPAAATAALPGPGPALPVVADPDGVCAPGPLVPAHDPAAHALAQRLGLPVVEVLDGAGRSLLPETAGFERERLRDWVVDRWGLRTAALPVEVWCCGRCDAELLQRLTWQWFLRMGPLGEPLLAAIAAGEVRLLPAGVTGEAVDWLRRAEDWCISRQIPWGHRIPARVCRRCAGWTLDRRRCCPECGAALDVERDVLDTWFSCALWPMATAGWPDEERMRRLYPMSAMTSGRDILFFLFIRMLVLDRFLTGEYPTSTCYFHGLVVAADGAKMSKSRGNTVTVRDALASHEADVVRSALLAGCSASQDVRLRDQLFAGAEAMRERLVEVGRLAAAGLLPPDDGLTAWAAAMVDEAQELVAAAMERFAYAEAVRALAGVGRRVVGRWLRARLSGGAPAGGELGLVWRLGRLFEPFMPSIGGRLQEVGSRSPEAPDQELVGAAAAYVAVVEELEQLRGAAGINTSQPIALSLPEDAWLRLAGQAWLTSVCRLRLLPGAAPGPETVPWRSTRSPGAVLHLPAALRDRVLAEAVRRLRSEGDELRRLRRALALLEAGNAAGGAGLRARHEVVSGRVRALRANAEAARRGPGGEGGVPWA